MDVPSTSRSEPPSDSSPLPARTSPAARTIPRLLATKLTPPGVPSNEVARPRLIARLQAGLRGPLTLIAAPAGSGKTTVLIQGLRRMVCPAAWVSLDAGDNDPTRFWSYVAAALGTLTPGIETSLLPLLHAPHPPTPDAVATTLIDALSALGDDVVLALDDYHAIETAAIHTALALLLAHMPPHLHLVLTTRSDPPLPLARLRVRGQLTELRVAEVRFTLDETAAFLTGAMGLQLDRRDVTALATRTEGWIAGLQLAALSLQQRDDVAGFIASFTGSHRFVLDYLMEEVIERQPQEVQRFLLQTGILDQLCGELCDAVTEEAAGMGQARLENLERCSISRRTLAPIARRR